MNITTKRLVVLLFIYSVSTILHISAQKDSKPDYDYKHPEEWSKTFPYCGGLRQSPIALTTHDIAKNYSSKLIFERIHTVPKSLKLENDGHHVILHIEYEDGQEGLSFTGGPLGERIYEMTSVEFHWGATNEDGSEHNLEGRPGVLEAAFWLYNTDYKDFEDAMDKPNGLAAASKIIDIEDDPEKQIGNNKGLKKIAKALDKIIEPGSQVDIKPFPLEDFLPPEYVTEKQTIHLVYEGSMTKPPCYETVTWLISLQRLYVPSTMMKAVRKIKLGHNDDHNNRPIQPRNGRTFSLVDSNEEEVKTGTN